MTRRLIAVAVSQALYQLGIEIRWSRDQAFRRAWNRPEGRS